MNDTLLISLNEKQMLEHAGDRPPLGLMYISAALNQNNIKNTIMDMNHCSFSDVITEVKNNHPEYVGISVPSTPTLQQAKNLGEKLKRYSKIVFGGTGASTTKQKLPGIVLKGAGESKFVNLIKSTSESFDIDTYPIPNRQGIDNTQYDMQIQGIRTTPMVSARGCKQHCTFCGDINKREQFRKLENIAQELDEIQSLGYGGVYLYNENFLSNLEHAEGVCKEMEKRGLKYRVEARGADISLDVAKMLKQTGCMMVAVGVESADDYVLRTIKKGETLNEIERGFQNLHQVGIQSKGYFMFGLPEQTELSAHASIRFAERMKQYGMSSADFYAYTPYPGSVLANNLDRYGMSLNTSDYEKFMQAGKLPVTPVIQTKDLTAQQIKGFISYANRKVNGK